MATKKLNQVLATEKSVRTRTNDAITALDQVAKKGELFEGFTRTYRVTREDEKETHPDERRLVQYTAPAIVRDALTNMTELIDIEATKDAGNAGARADVVLDGVVIAPAVQATTLLFVDRQLDYLAGIVKKLPTLDPAHEWNPDKNQSDLHRAAPTATIKTKKVPRVITKAHATVEHPAQAEVYYEDMPVGQWDKTELSGAFPAPVKERLLARIVTLQEAVNEAREEANLAPAEEKKIAAEILGWLTRGVEAG